MSSSAQSHALFERAQRTIPGGVNSPVRAFRGVGGEPLFIERAEGPFIFDKDGRRYIDYVGSWGPMILGHRAPEIVEAIERALHRGTSFGAPTDLEVEMAELVCELVPSVEMVRMVNSGTEATMSALRLARGYTRRDYVLKFNGCYHGHAESFLVKAGSGVATCGIAGSPGVPDAFARLTLSVEYNDLQAAEQAINGIGPNQLAAIIVEPVAGNMGLVLPEPEFLPGLRSICDKAGALLIFDEVMTGFRLSAGGAEEFFGVTPDLSTFGKIIGGGLPVGAFGGKAEIMRQLAPLGPVYQAGTLSGNPLAMAAGLAALHTLQRSNPYPKLAELGARWADGFKAIGLEHEIPLTTANCGSMVGMYFSKNPVRNFSDAQKSDVEFFKRFFHAMLEEGVYLAPSAFEAGFISTAHTPELIDATLAAARQALRKLEAQA